jgi:PAS domain S-box-containing protein
MPTGEVSVGPQQPNTSESLKEHQSYTRELFESSVDALTTTDESGLITDANRQMCDMTGCTRDQLVGTLFGQYFTDAERAADCIHHVLADRRVTNYELTVRAEDGHQAVVSCNATLLQDQTGRVRGIFVAARDITEQKRVEEALRASETKFQGILALAADAIITMDESQQIIHFNYGAEQLFGYTAHEMMGKTLETLLPHRFRAAHRGHVATFDHAHVVARRMGERQDIFALRKNGDEFPAEASISKLGTAGQRLFTVILRDISRQKALEEQLRRQNEALEEQNRQVQEANRLKSEFLANMSHELRTPLNAIVGFAEIMHDGRVGPIASAHREYLGDILTSARHLLQLINDILDLAKVESGKFEFHPEVIDLASLCRQVRDNLRTLAAKKRIQVDLEISEIVTKVTADSAKLKQVLYNYLSNAIKFTPDGGCVTIRVLPAGDTEFRLEVEDTGIGIREDDLPRLFREFEQLDAGAAKKFQGTGLGLALTRRLVEAQAGQVGVQSTLGAGSVFYAILPRAATAEMLPTSERPVPPTSLDSSEPDA